MGTVSHNALNAHRVTIVDSLLAINGYGIKATGSYQHHDHLSIAFTTVGDVVQPFPKHIGLVVADLFKMRLGPIGSNRLRLYTGE